jgi:AmmeMemoRadiSam system protein A
MSEPGTSTESQRHLLGVARRAIEARLRGRARPEERSEEALRVPRGAFVTLRTRKGERLRGCVGYVEPLFPLAETVARAAVAAATEDGRFPSVTLEELDALVIEISILTPLSPIRAEEVEVGRHGLMLRHAGRSGLLLPQVPTEQGWDRETFLEHTCLKAGLEPSAWREPEAELLGFTAIVFSED